MKQNGGGRFCLSFGETYGIEYLLGEGRSIDEFYEISREEYEKLMVSENVTY